jgi:glycerophosphoryl diester phosphodiesterase
MNNFHILILTGACGYLPEHSLQAHQLAIDLGTDYIEPDLCLSKDLELVVLHDSTLDETTNIRDHPEFADRETDGHFYVYDFTLVELKTLRLRQRVSERTTLSNDIFTIPTFDEVMHLVCDNYEYEQSVNTNMHDCCFLFKEIYLMKFQAHTSKYLLPNTYAYVHTL